MSSGTSKSSSTSVSLIQRARRFDAEAWERLCDIYGPLVYRWARQAGLHDEDAADIGQEVFRTVAVRIHSFRKERPGDTFRGWLRTITRNKLGDFMRAAGNQPRAEGGTDAYQRMQQQPDRLLEADSDCEAGFDEESTILGAALAVLRNDFEDTTWQAFWRATVEDQPHDVIAEALGISRQAVRQAKYRVLSRLRQELCEDELL